MRYTFVKQQDMTDCAAACLAMVCLHYKKETTVTLLRDRMGTDIKGTNLIGLAKCARELGFQAEPARLTREEFDGKFTLPAIANVLTKYGQKHFVVVFKITAKYVIVGDPGRDLIKQPKDEFFKTFTGAMLFLAPGGGFVSEKLKNKTVLERYKRLLAPHTRLFVYGILASALLTVLGILSSLFNSIIYDEILPYGQKDALRMLLLIFAGIALVQTVLSFVRQWMMMFLSIKIDIPLMLGYFDHVYHLPMKFFSTRKTGDITTRFSDAFTIKDIFTNIALTLIIDIAMTLITGIILCRMNGSLFLIILLMTVLSILLVLIYKQPYKRINEEQMQQAAVLNSQIIEGLRAVETIKGNANEDSEMEKLEQEYIRSLRIGIREQKLSLTQGTISGLVATAGNLFLTYRGIIQVMDGKMTLGSMMAFMTMAAYFTDPVSRLVSLQLSIQEANISMKRMAELLDYQTEKEQEAGARDIDTFTGTLKFSHISFRYGTRQPVLQDVSFTVEAGQKVALVGESGSGKSTIAKLLLRYYEPESGEITIDGVNLAELSSESLRRAISYVPQNIELFSRTISDNIRISKRNATTEEIQEAARRAGAHDFIRRLPLGYETFLEEAGGGLSGGEKQRIALARAFLKENSFYILDESTSNLDFATENLIFDMIYNRFAGKSMLIIAHRLATVKNCDQILVLDKGRIIERGTHEELLSQNGRYRTLWELQQENYIPEKREPEEKQLEQSTPADISAVEKITY